MVSHTRRRGARRLASLPVVLTAIAACALVSACDKVPLLAPAGTVITIFPANTTVPVNGEVEIIATVIENGTAPAATGTTTTTTSRPSAGTPVQNGTLVSFTTTLGRIEPREARTNNGEVRVKFISDGTSGSATITAYSGGAVGTLDKLLVGSAAAERITVSAGNLGPGGGSTTVTARLETLSGSGIAGVPVTFTTTTGSVNPNPAFTDGNGVATTTLTTNAKAEVTATAGAKSGKITVDLAPRSGLEVTATPQTTTAGAPVTFSIKTTPGQVVTNARIDYGDGESRSLGTISGTRSDTHTYTRSGNFQVTVTADNGENAGTSVSVGGLPVTLTANPQRTSPNTPITFTATTGTASPQVDHYIFTYDDGTRNRTTGPSDSHSFAARGNHTARVDVIGVGGVLLGSASATVTIEGL